MRSTPPADLDEILRRFDEEVNKRPARRPFGPLLACSACHGADFGVRHVGDTCAACAVDPGEDSEELLQLAEDALRILGPRAFALLEEHLDRLATTRELLTP